MCYWFVFETVMYYVCVDVFVVCYQILYFCNKTLKKFISWLNFHCLVTVSGLTTEGLLALSICPTQAPQFEDH